MTWPACRTDDDAEGTDDDAEGTASDDATAADDGMGADDGTAADVRCEALVPGCVATADVGLVGFAVSLAVGAWTAS